MKAFLIEILGNLCWVVFAIILTLILLNLGGC